MQNLLREKTNSKEGFPFSTVNHIFWGENERWSYETSAEYFDGKERIAHSDTSVLAFWFFSQSASDPCDGKHSPGSLVFFALGSYLCLNRGGEKGLNGELFKDHPALAL